MTAPRVSSSYATLLYNIELELAKGRVTNAFDALSYSRFGMPWRSSNLYWSPLSSSSTSGTRIDQAALQVSAATNEVSLRKVIQLALCRVHKLP